MSSSPWARIVRPAGTAIPLDQTPSTTAPNSPIGPPGRFFHEQSAPGFTAPCFSRAPPFVLLIHRAAFFVAMYDDDGNPATPERTPYLMLHQGLDMPTATNAQGDGTIDLNDAVPVAEGIEQLQVAYVLDTNVKDADKTPIILGVNAPMPADHYGEKWEQSDLANLPHGWFFNVGFNAVDPCGDALQAPAGPPGQHPPGALDGGLPQLAARPADCR